MATRAEIEKRHRRYPFLSRLEWHLAGSRYFAYGIDHFVYRPRFLWHNWRRRRRISPESLMNFESKVFSQNGEDGVLQEIFRRVGEGEKFCVEFGIQGGAECCTRNLLVNHGWKGLLIEGSVDESARAAAVYSLFPAVAVVHSFITRDNILGIFREQMVPESPDLIVVDIDGNDFWVLEQILSAYRPRVVVCEYSARWVPPREWVMPYDPAHEWDGSAYFGASLTSLRRLGQEKGYVLVGCESRGVNAFFVRRDLIGDHFPDCGLGDAHYVPPHYGRGYGHTIRHRG